MDKHDAVERLMKLATGKPVAAAQADAETVLEAQVSRGERLPAPVESSAGERGRQLLGAIRPFLPAAAGALRLVDHGAVQALARFLPLLGAAREAAGAVTSTKGPEKAGSSDALAALEKRSGGLADELKGYKARVDTLEEQLRRTRETLERTVVEQGTLSLMLHKISDRSRLLTAGVVILFMLVIAEMVMLIILLHR